MDYNLGKEGVGKGVEVGYGGLGAAMRQSTINFNRVKRAVSSLSSTLRIRHQRAAGSEVEE